MSGRWVETKRTRTVWEVKWTVRGYGEPHSDEDCFAATATIQGVRMVLSRCADMRDKGCEAFVGDNTQVFLGAEVPDGEQLFAQPPERWTPKHLLDGRRAVWKVRKCQACGHCRDAGKSTSRENLKEQGFVQDERDLCLFIDVVRDICISVHVDDMLAVGPKR